MNINLTIVYPDNLLRSEKRTSLKDINKESFAIPSGIIERTSHLIYLDVNRKECKVLSSRDYSELPEILNVLRDLTRYPDLEFDNYPIN